MRFFQVCLIALVLGFTQASFAAVNDSAVTEKWGYKGPIGPDAWGRISPAFTTCMLGKFQSPVNIGTENLEAPNRLKFSYRQAPLFIVDDGDTDLTIGRAQFVVNTGHGVQLNFHNDTVKESIRYMGERYELVQLHFHTPSENQINGDDYPMEIHFVHQGEQGHVLVVSVMVKGGDRHPEIAKIIKHLPKRHGKEVEVKDADVNPEELLPMLRSYYSFMGSLTTPPCTEGVQWVVMEEPIIASPAQIMAIRKASGGSNARGVQALNDRVISFSMEKQS